MQTAVLLLAISASIHEGDVQAFVSLTDPKGAVLADGRYAQKMEGDTLRIKARYDFPDGRVVEEEAVVRMRPAIEQKSWDWTEKKDGAVLRAFSADFASGVARGRKGKDSWNEKLEIHPGKTFAGIAFVLAVKNLHALVPVGKSFELEAIAFTPKPRTAGIELRHDGPQRIRMAGRTVPADAWTLHPEVPAIAKLFVKVPDQHVWLSSDQPVSFLGFEGPLAEPGDPVIRIETIPSAPAARAKGPAARRSKQQRPPAPPAR